MSAVGEDGEVTTTSPVPADPAALVHVIVWSLTTAQLVHETVSSVGAVAQPFRPPTLSVIVTAVLPPAGPLVGEMLDTALCTNVAQFTHAVGDDGEETVTFPVPAPYVPAGSVQLTSEEVPAEQPVSETPL